MKLKRKTITSVDDTVKNIINESTVLKLSSDNILFCEIYNKINEKDKN